MDIIYILLQEQHARRDDHPTISFMTEDLAWDPVFGTKGSLNVLVYNPFFFPPKQR
jgi:hypothetical protein